MRKAKELIGKSIVHQSTGERIAEVRDLVFESDARHVAAVMVDQGGWFRDARVILWSSIVSIGDAMMVQGEAPIVVASEAPTLRDELQQDIRITGAPIMTDTGDRIGTVGDLYINDNGEVVGYEVRQGFMSDLAGRKFLAAEDVQTVGRDAIIASHPNLVSAREAAARQSELEHSVVPPIDGESAIDAPAADLDPADQPTQPAPSIRDEPRL